MQVQQRPYTINIGCTDFAFTAENNAYFAARTMEFPVEMESQISIYPRNQKYVSSAPDEAIGLEWTSKYGFVGIDGFHMKGIDEGMNEKGLSFGCLTLLETQYPTVPTGENAKALSLMDVGAWILSNFENVDDVVEGLKEVRIWEGTTEVLGTIPALHLALHDATGKNIVIEFINGEVIIHENKLGVLTNDPLYEKQLENLNQLQYQKLSPFPLSGRGIGTGMIGLPGDGSSESRFVRIAKNLQFALQPKDEIDALKCANDILDTVAIPEGTMIVPLENSNLYETTRWRVIKDLTHKIFYYSPCNDPTLRKLDLSIQDLSGKKTFKKLNIMAEKPTIIDVSNDF